MIPTLSLNGPGNVPHPAPKTRSRAEAQQGQAKQSNKEQSKARYSWAKQPWQTKGTPGRAMQHNKKEVQLTSHCLLSKNPFKWVTPLVRISWG